MLKTVLPLIRRSWRSESGSASIEFAAIGTILILVTLGVFELARFAFTRQTLLSATSVAARMAGMDASNEAIENRIRSRLPLREQEAVTVSIAPQLIGGLTYRRIEAEIDLPLIMPNFGLFPGNVINVRAVHLVPAG
jgi:Flp pilus assembly protein TadG